jgi:hypothetical protein
MVVSKNGEYHSSDHTKRGSKTVSTTTIKYQANMISRLHVTISVVLCVFLADRTVLAKPNRDLPHPHSGFLKPYDAGPFDALKLDKNDEKCLAEGKPVMKQTEGDLGGGAICVQDIDAPKQAVWAQILDLDSYKGKVNKVNEAKNYFLRNNLDGTTTVKTKMVLGVMPGYSVSRKHVNGC